MSTDFTLLARIIADTVQLQNEMRSAMGKIEGQAQKSSGRISRGMRKAFRSAATVAGGTLAGAAVASLRSKIALRKTLDDIEIQAGATKTEMDGLAESIRKTSRATAISRQDLALASKRLVDLLGPAGKSAELMDLLARTAVASGADIKDLAGLISAVSDSMGIAADDTEGMERALSAFLSAGKQGKVPLEEMSVVLQDIASTFADVSSGGAEAAADLAAALQVARKSFGSAAKAGTGLEAFIGALVKKSAALKKVGVEVFTGEGPEKRLLPLRDILDQVQARGLNIEQLMEGLGRKEAIKFAKALTDVEGRKTFEDIAAAARKATDVADDFGKRTESDVFRIQQASNQAKAAVSDLFTPERVKAFTDAVVLAAAVVGGLLDKLIKAGELVGGLGGKTTRALATGGFSKIDDKIAELEAEEKARARKAATEAGVLRGRLIDPEALQRARAEVAENEAFQVDSAPIVGVPGAAAQAAERDAARRELSAESAAILELAQQPGLGVGAGSERFQREQSLAAAIASEQRQQAAARASAREFQEPEQAGLARDLERQLLQQQNVAIQQQTDAVVGAVNGLTRQLAQTSPIRSGRQSTGAARRPLSTGTRQ